MSNPAVNLDSLHAAMKAAIAAQFPDAHVEFYDRPGERIPTPAILLDLEDIPAQDPDDIGTEQLPVMLNFNAYCVLSYKAGKKQAVKTMAAAVMAFVRGKRWSCPVGAASVVGASPDLIPGKDDDYEVMRVEFQHEALLGTDVWEADQLLDEEGEPLPPPSEVYVADVAPGDPPLTEESYTDIANCGCDEP